MKRKKRTICLEKMHIIEIVEKTHYYINEITLKLLRLNTHLRVCGLITYFEMDIDEIFNQDATTDLRWDEEDQILHIHRIQLADHHRFASCKTENLYMLTKI